MSNHRADLLEKLIKEDHTILSFLMSIPIKKLVVYFKAYMSRKPILDILFKVFHRQSGDFMNIKIISIIALVALVILFIIQNVTVVEITFLFWSLQMSRALFIFFLLAIGIAIGWLLHAHFKGD